MPGNLIRPERPFTAFKPEGIEQSLASRFEQMAERLETWLDTAVLRRYLQATLPDYMVTSKPALGAFCKKIYQMASAICSGARLRRRANLGAEGA